jgi:hypothetical protein
MSSVLRLAYRGNPVLRMKPARLSRAEILSEEAGFLIESLWEVLLQQHYGLGLCATQVGWVVGCDGACLLMFLARATSHSLPAWLIFCFVLIH